MSRVFIIPDVHLKPWVFEKATELIEKDGSFDRVVMLGDFVDDWNQEKNLNLYRQTFEAIYGFIDKYPNTLYCFGNHDVSYLYGAFETGYSSYARSIVVEGINNILYKLPVDNSSFIHRIDNVLFSHAGLTEKYVKRCFGSGHGMDIDEMIDRINALKKEAIWRDDSIIWARPQYSAMRLYPMELMQVVGHTPVDRPLLEGKLLSLDTFSTYPDGRPIGDEKFVWVDTETEEYHVIE